jgi:tetratricopeptide (TPR) repeat protein
VNVALVDWFLRGALKLHRANLKNLISLSAQKSMAFREQDRWREALAMMESVACIEPADYVDPSVVFAKLRRRLEGIDPVTALAFLLELNTLLFISGHQELAVELLELETGLHPEDYADPERIALRLQERLTDFRPNQIFAYGFKLATTLGHGERTEDALAVLEAILCIRLESFSDIQQLSLRLRNPPYGVEREGWLAAIFSLLWLLDQVGRHIEGLALFEATFGITEEDYSSPEQLREKVQLPPGTEPLMVFIAGVLFSLGRFPAALALLELFLEIQPTDYRDPVRLAQRQGLGKRRLPRELYDASLLTVLGTLLVEERTSDALAYCMSDAVLNDADLAKPDRVVRQLQARCRLMPPDAAGRYIFMASMVLIQAGFAEAATAALEADAEFAGLDWENLPVLSEALDGRLGNLLPTGRLMYVFQIYQSLSETGRPRKAALLIDAYVRALSPLAGRQEDPYLGPILCVIFEIWLAEWAQDSSRHPLELCRSLMPYLRESLARQGIWIQDRERFIREVGNLRRRIVQTGLYWAAREADPVRAQELQRTVLLWDLELAQRLLVERFLLGEISAVPAGEPPITGVWPLQRHEELHTPGYLPSAGEVLAAVGVLDKSAPSP